jgi:hypothetical protein
VGNHQFLLVLTIISRAVRPNAFCTLFLRVPQLRGTKLDKSRGSAVDLPYFLSKYDPDPLRPPAPLFRNLGESVVEEEYARLEG